MFIVIVMACYSLLVIILQCHYYALIVISDAWPNFMFTVFASHFCTVAACVWLYVILVCNFIQ